MILQSFIITTYLWFLNKSQKSIFFFPFSIIQPRYERRRALSSCVHFSFHMEPSPSRVYCKLALVSGITVRDLKAGLTSLSSVAVLWFPLASSAKITGVPERTTMCSGVLSLERWWGGQAGPQLPPMDSSGKKEAHSGKWYKVVPEAGGV